VEVLQLRMAGIAGSMITGIYGETKDDLLEDEEPLEQPSKVSSKSTKKSASKKYTSEGQPSSVSNKKEKDLSQLLSEVTGRADIAVDSDEDVIVESAISNKVQ
jgi:hypothetical protein